MHQLVFGSCSVRTFVREKNRDPTNAEKAIGYEHGLVVPEVPILGYVLGTNDDGVGVGVSLKDVFCEVNGDDAPALQPMPPRLKLLALPRSLYLLTIMEEREGVGLKRLQLTTRMPMSLGLTREKLG